MRGARSGLRGEGDVVPQFLEKLDEAVKMEMVSDVPFGAFLSGGLDSSTIVALMTRHNNNVKTFSVGFGEGGYSELEYASVVARHFGTNHHELVVGFDDIVENLPKLVGYRDAPVSEPSDIPIYMLAKEASKTVKMVLTGEGSDEILGGYPKHVFERFAQGYQLMPGMIRHNLIAPLTQSLPYGFRRAKTAITNLNIEDWRERYVRWFGALNHRERDELSVLRMNGYDHGNDCAALRFAPDSTTLRRILYFDQTSWLPDNLLERGDRMTMAASIESRCSVPRPRARGVRLVAARQLPGEGPQDEVDPAPGGPLADPRPHPGTQEGGFPRAGEQMVPGAAQRVPVRPPARFGVEDARLLRPASAGPDGR
jgi:asparagine synthase (glutamine-hydrolysing)